MGVVEKVVVGKVIVSVVCLDGIIVFVEIKQFEKIYLSLGLDFLFVLSNIYQYFVIEYDFVLFVLIDQLVVGFILDVNVFVCYEFVMDDVCKLLNIIFIEEELEELESVLVLLMEVGGFDFVYSQFYCSLLEKEQWF